MCTCRRLKPNTPSQVKQNANNKETTMVNFFITLWMKYLRNFWSMIRWCGKRKIDSEPVFEVTDSNLKATLRDVYSHYTWTADDLSQLGDSICPPPYLYNWYLDIKNSESSDKVKGDCDDYHALIYHILKNNGYEVALISLATKPITQSHTMTVIKDTAEDGSVSYRVIDYTSVKTYASLEEFIGSYKLPVRVWTLDIYDYEARRFRNLVPNKF